jgi:hypothetical protein
MAKTATEYRKDPSWWTRPDSKNHGFAQSRVVCQKLKFSQNMRQTETLNTTS